MAATMLLSCKVTIICFQRVTKMFSSALRLFRNTKHAGANQVKLLLTANSRSSSSTPVDYWDYSVDHGVNKWQNTWKFNARQSPIDILTSLAVYDPKLGEFKIDRTPLNLKSQNVGMNVSTVPIDDQKEILLTGGALTNCYQLREFHFHWGEKNSCGCEHTLNGHRFAAELHLVHWNVDLYKTEAEALSSKDGLAVLGVFLEASPHYAPNAALNTILDLFQQVPYKNQSHVSSPTVLTPYSLLPSNTTEYFTYPGSLTTPPLTENVTWTVFRHPLKISRCQIERFNQLYAVEKVSKGDAHTVDYFVRSTHAIPQPPTITNNHRPVQALNGRIVHSSFQVE